MAFDEERPIYIQIAERMCDEILSDTYKVGERIPGVREYSALLEVNVNTTVKSYDLLAKRNIIFMKRGLGYYVADNAPQLIKEERKQHFSANILPRIFGQMKLLGISFEDVEKEWKTFLNNDKTKNEKYITNLSYRLVHSRYFPMQMHWHKAKGALLMHKAKVLHLPMLWHYQRPTLRLWLHV